MQSIIVLLAISCAAQTAPAETLEGLFSNPGIWTRVHCDLAPAGPGSVRATFWKGYEDTGLETGRLPVADWTPFKSLRFEVENPYREPFSVFVRISDRPAPGADTYTGGTFDGFVIGPGRTTVEISLESMRSREQKPVDAGHIAHLGISFQPLFLRDGLDLKFRTDSVFALSNLRLSAEPARLQRQPYADPLFSRTEDKLSSRRREVEQSIDDLRKAIEEAKARGIETAYAEIYPFLADIAFRSRLVAFWQDRAEEQGRALGFLQEGSRQAARELRGTPDGHRGAVPPVPDYARLSTRDGYFRLGETPALLFGMLYNRQGSLLRWFANSETDYGTELVAGGTRHNVEKQPIWEAYHKYPDTHRVGWPHSDHIIRDNSSWEVVGPPVNVCLESPHSREAIAKMIETFERTSNGRAGAHLLQNMGYEYTYVCYCDYTKRMWAEWLGKKHSAIGAANRIWGTRFQNFEEVPMPRPENAASNRALWFDWGSFNLYRFLEQIRWTRDQIRRWEPDKPLTVGSPYYAFDPGFWTAVDEEELADSGITGVVLEENYELDTLMPEYLHALAGGKPVADFEYHGVVHQILPSFLHGDAAISMWWWNDRKRWTPNEPINEWTTSFPQSYTIPLSDLAKAMRDSLDLRRLGAEIAALASAPREVAILYSKSSMLQQAPGRGSQYLPELRRVYNASQPAGLYVGLTTEKRILAGDLRGRRVLVLPAAEFVPRAVSDAILRWVEDGGTLIVSPDSLTADEYGRPSAIFEALGLRLLRTEPAQLKRGETIVTPYNSDDLPRMRLAGSDGLQAAGRKQMLEAPDASVAARFEGGSPALIRLKRGKGTIFWLAAPLDNESWPRFLAATVKPPMQVLHDGRAAPSVEHRVAEWNGKRLAYLYNNSDEEEILTLAPAFAFSSIVDRRTEKPVSGRELRLPGRETAILEFR